MAIYRFPGSICALFSSCQSPTHDRVPSGLPGSFRHKPRQDAKMPCKLRKLLCVCFWSSRRHRKRNNQFLAWGVCNNELTAFFFFFLRGAARYFFSRGCTVCPYLGCTVESGSKFVNSSLLQTCGILKLSFIGVYRAK